MSMSLEALAGVYSLLNGDTTLTTGGIKPDGTSRNVSVYNQTPPNTARPYIRLWLTDTNLIGDEPLDYTTKRPAKQLNFMITIYSDWEPELFNLQDRLLNLLDNVHLVTPNFEGTLNVVSNHMWQDQISFPDHTIRRADFRMEARMQPKT